MSRMSRLRFPVNIVEDDEDFMRAERMLRNAEISDRTDEMRDAVHEARVALKQMAFREYAMVNADTLREAMGLAERLYALGNDPTSRMDDREDVGADLARCVRSFNPRNR